MKVIISMLILVLLNAAYATLPYNVEEEARFSSLENDERLLKLSYSFTDNPLAAAGTVELGSSVPAGSLITQSAYFVTTQVVSSDSNTLALSCESANDLVTAADLSGKAANSINDGQITALSGSVYSSAGCTPTWTAGAGASGIESGVLVAILKYIQPAVQ